MLPAAEPGYCAYSQRASLLHSESDFTNVYDIQHYGLWTKWHAGSAAGQKGGRDIHVSFGSEGELYLPVQVAF